MNQLKEEMDPPLKNAAALSYRLRALENVGLILNDTDKKPGKQVKIFYEITKTGCKALVHMKELENIMREVNSKTEIPNQLK